MNEKTQPFDLEKWLESKKKGFGGKVPRADFIAKIKELNELAEQFKKEKSELNKKLTGELESLKSDLTAREQIIKGNETGLKNQEKTITEVKQELTEKDKILQNQAGELEKLKQRPDITGEKYQELQGNLSDLQSKCDELLNNQEKHGEKDLKPTNLPEDWEKQLADKETIEKNFADTEKKISTLEEKLSAEQKNFLQAEEKLIEAEKRPTAEIFQQAIQQEREKYKDYGEIKTELKNKSEQLEQSLSSLEKERKQKKGADKEIISELEIKIKERDQIIAELNQPTKSISKVEQPQFNSELIISEIKKLFANELFNILKEISTNLFSLQSEIAQLKPGFKNTEQLSSQFPTDYEEVKKINRELYEILAGVKKILPKNELRVVK